MQLHILMGILYPSKKIYLTLLSITFLLFLLIIKSYGEGNTILNNITGTVYEISNNAKEPLVGAHIYWEGTRAGTTTDPSGKFKLERKDGNDFLIVSFAGYKPDTVEAGSKKYIEVILENPLELNTVNVVKRRKTTELSMIDPIKIEHLGEGELKKAACCNLSESFETNPSVDVSFTDAITGTRQIQMLGLAGPYTQITRENIPDIRGLSAIYGMEYIPGPWIESIQLSKGTGSVANGFESIAGQINVELKKPETAERLYLNVYASDDSRMEGNLNLNHKFKKHWATGLLVHARNQSMETDHNDDGFIDKPVGTQYSILNRWKYSGDKGWESQFGIKGTTTESTGGQSAKNQDNIDSLWIMNMNTNRMEGWLKVGRVSESNPLQSFGLQLSAIYHDQTSQFGMKNYGGTQKSFYGNFIFQSNIGDSSHSYRTGISFQHDDFDETLDSLQFFRSELIPGLFVEYTYSFEHKIVIVAGARADYHNNFGLFLTPRIHMRYSPTHDLAIRLAAGKGQRTASIFSENSSVLASSRSIILMNDNSDKPYGLEPEKAWNFGLNITQKFRLDYRDGAISADVYYTNFENQVIADLDQSPQSIVFYNLSGKSDAYSLQVQLDYEFIRRLDIRLAYRYYNVYSDYISGYKSKPLISKHRAFINLAYTTRNRWKFDLTLQWYGPKRIPNTESNPEPYQLENYSPSFMMLNGQISKELGNKLELYLGAENILNYMQDNPILSGKDPFSPYFDSGLAWGPIYGRMIYTGIRFKIK